MNEEMHETKSIMLEHLKELKKAAEDCDEQYLGVITSAMVMTADFIFKAKID